MKQRTKRFSKVMVRCRLPVPEIRFLMCQISRALRSLKRATLCVNAVMTPMAKKVCTFYIISYNKIYWLQHLSYILYISLLYAFLYYFLYKMFQLHLVNVDGRCIIVHCASSCYICTRMSMASVMTVYTMLYVFIMHWLPKRPITQRSSMFFDCRLLTRLSISFKQGWYFLLSLENVYLI